MTHSPTSGSQDSPATTRTVIAIDIGANEIRIIVYQDDNVKILVDKQQFPTCISFGSDSPIPRIGAPAYRHSMIHPRGTLFNVLDIFDGHPLRHKSFFPPWLMEVQGELPGIHIKVPSGNCVSSIELLAMLLSRTKLDAKAALGLEPAAVVVSRPYCWGARQRQMLKGAVEIAGLELAGSFACAEISPCGAKLLT
jgi:molecular chaperone DnaK (HSP70)